MAFLGVHTSLHSGMEVSKQLQYQGYGKNLIVHSWSLGDSTRPCTLRAGLSLPSTWTVAQVRSYTVAIGTVTTWHTNGYNIVVKQKVYYVHSWYCQKQPYGHQVALLYLSGKFVQSILRDKYILQEQHNHHAHIQEDRQLHGKDMQHNLANSIIIILWYNTVATA